MVNEIQKVFGIHISFLTECFSISVQTNLIEGCKKWTAFKVIIRPKINLIIFKMIFALEKWVSVSLKDPNFHQIGFFTNDSYLN
jgi:hypothetical protein